MIQYDKKQKILIADDEPLNIAVVADILSCEYDLLVATNGEKVIQIVCSDQKPDLILLDIMMPGMNGFDVAKWVKQNSDTAHIPIIFLTAKHDNESVVKGFELGAVDFVSKPFNKEELLARLKNTLQMFSLRNALNRALDKSQQYAKTIESQMKLIDKNIIISSTDLEGNIIEVSDAFCQISGHKKEYLLGKNHRIMRHPEVRPPFFVKMWETIVRGDTWHGEIRNRSKKGETYWLDTVIYPISNDIGEKIGYTAISHNITNKKRVEELSITDILTQLHNRMYLENSFMREIKRSKRYNHPFAVIMLDIDYFKTVNDTYGHDVGDNVLVMIGKLLSENIRETDILGRWGGEEFLIICPHTTDEEAFVLAEKIRKTIESYPFDIVGQKTCSFGISVFDLKDVGYKEVVKRSDEALYKAKENGRNCVVDYNVTFSSP
ncbi:MAG: diguanylate cyclase [Sulfuricurvum sp.]|uniref:diguanylate cyclase n=1 Tax=Sulfuricurvum sp. TaxID=2025608 RepID=UPI0025D1DBC4|nr:diguanylate cyclase [Sulfuricurvum sp.]MBV5321270.1 diguanylate cyclase [Sulfuricurvum sp.]